MHNSTITRIPFSGRMAIVALLVSTFVFIGQANAEEFTAKEKAAIAEHHEIIDRQLTKSEQSIESDLQSEFDQQIEESEQEFMQLACTAHGLEFDETTEVCFE
ncbi:hypothetical protein AB4298_14115 [Shewanella sp. 10N.261.52.F9]|uniref:hypothetical protein n=1 Tax=Shewanella TaxID=22 RepID=UPI00200C45B4|nr:hypothetical protein [Shewanella marinintestina]MCL1146494.1 hypothetical protein [Shewanella marinintestina]